MATAGIDQGGNQWEDSGAEGVKDLVRRFLVGDSPGDVLGGGGRSGLVVRVCGWLEGWRELGYALRGWGGLEGLG